MDSVLFKASYVPFHSIQHIVLLLSFWLFVTLYHTINSSKKTKQKKTLGLYLIPLCILKASYSASLAHAVYLVNLY